MISTRWSRVIILINIFLNFPVCKTLNDETCCAIAQLEQGYVSIVQIISGSELKLFER